MGPYLGRQRIDTGGKEGKKSIDVTTKAQYEKGGNIVERKIQSTLAYRGEFCCGGHPVSLGVSPRLSMKILLWNVKGMCSQSKRVTIKKIIMSKTRFHFLKKTDLRHVKHHCAVYLGSKHAWIVKPSIGVFGGIFIV